MKQEIKVPRHGKSITILEQEIQMALDNLTDERVSNTAKGIIAADLEEKYKQLHELYTFFSLNKNESKEVVENNEAADIERKWITNVIRLEDEERIASNTLKDGEVGKISQFTIKEPVLKNRFLVNGLERLHIDSSDIVSVNDNTVSKCLTIVVRDNYVLFPYVYVSKVIEGNYTDTDDYHIDDITVDVLSANLKSSYRSTYYGDNLHIESVSEVEWRYDNSTPQTFEIKILYGSRKTEVIGQDESANQEKFIGGCQKVA